LEENNTRINLDEYKKQVMAISKKFEKKIQSLFEKAGFEVKSNFYAKGPDIIAESEGIKILIQCKCSTEEGKPLPFSLESLVDEYSKKVDKERAKIAILAISGYKIPEKYQDEEYKKELLEKDHVIIWDDQLIEYYEDVVKALGNFAKYNFLGDFKIKDEFGKPYVTPFLKISQGKYELFIFKISPEILLKIAYIFRREYSPKGYQRMLNIRRLKKEIAEFLQREEALLPTPIVCVFDEGIKIENNSLVIPLKYHSIWIIDGQHRLYSFCYVPQPIRENFQLLCVGFDGKELREKDQAEIFIDINEKAKKISKLLLLDLYELVGIRDIRVEIVKTLKDKPPFKDKIKLPRFKKGKISLVSFALTSPMKQLVGERGFLAKVFEERVGERVNFENEDVYIKFKEFCVKIFIEFFKEVGKFFPKEWNNSDDFLLATDRGIRGLLRLLLKIFEYNLRHKKSIDDKDTITSCLEQLKNFDFRNESHRGEYLGEGGADKLCEDWAKLIRIKLPDFAPKDKKEILLSIEIESGKKEEDEKVIKDFFPKLGREIVGELAYIDETTFKYLRYLPKDSIIKLMVSVVKEKEKCIEELNKMQKEGWKIQIKKVFKTILQQGKIEEKPYLHERWIGGENYEIDLNVDLKESTLGAKKHTIYIFHNIQFSERQDIFKQKWEGISRFGKEVSFEDLL